MHLKLLTKGDIGGVPRDVGTLSHPAMSHVMFHATSHAIYVEKIHDIAYCNDVISSHSTCHDRDIFLEAQYRMRHRVYSLISLYQN